MPGAADARASWTVWLADALPVVDGPSDPAAGVVDGIDLARLVDVSTLVLAVADALAALHALDPPPAVRAEAPAAGIEALVELAGRRVAAGLVDPERFDAPYRRYTPDQLVDLVRRSQPDEPDHPVVTLGSAHLRHLRVSVEGNVAGWAIEAAGGVVPAGVGDRYRDLAVVAIELAGVVSPETLGPVFDRYGLAAPELARLDFHVLVDQLLR
jgi:aminoglycoside phosphotransferase